MLKDGTAPSAILRNFAVCGSGASLLDLMQLAEDAFDLPFEATQCLGGWWHDGSGELSDDQIDAFLRRAIEERGGAKAGEASEPQTLPPSEPPTMPPPAARSRAVPTPATDTPTAGVPRLINRSVPGERYAVEDPANFRFMARGSVNASGELSIDLRMQLESGERSTLLRGSEQFQAILDFFRGKFTAFKGHWQAGSNLAKFNELTAEGVPEKVAAGLTWTGEQAKAAGYTKVTVQKTEGTPGHYTSVKVLFQRPQP
jgi:hypothetical protein